MVPSPLLKSWQIPQPASLVVLADSGGGVCSSCDDDRATQVDCTGDTIIDMLLVRNTTYLIITQ